MSGIGNWYYRVSLHHRTIFEVEERRFPFAIFPQSYEQNASYSFSRGRPGNSEKLERFMDFIEWTRERSQDEVFLIRTDLIGKLCWMTNGGNLITGVIFDSDELAVEFKLTFPDCTIYPSKM